MMKLQITDSEDCIVLTCQVPDNLDVAELTIAVLGAIKGLKPPKASRSDRGQPRGPRKPVVVPQPGVAA